MSILTPEARELLESDALVHVVTLNRGRQPSSQLRVGGLDGKEIVSEHMLRHQKVRNVERDPRIVLSLEGRGTSEEALDIVVDAWASITIEDSTHWQEVETINREIVEQLIAHELVLPDATAEELRLVIERWTFPLGSLDLSEKPVSVEDLQRIRGAWDPS